MFSCYNKRFSVTCIFSKVEYNIYCLSGGDIMVYCFDKNLPWDYSKREMAISKMSCNGILYDSKLKVFTDFEGKIIDIKDKLIFPRTGVAQINDMNDEIIHQGGFPVVSNDQIDIVESWPDYYSDERKSKLIKGRDLIDINVIKNIEAVYGQEIFIKTKSKNFSAIIPVSLLLDDRCAFYKTLLHHLDDDFIISKKVNIVEDKYGRKEYRCFIVNDEIYNISRCMESVLHNIDVNLLNKAQKIVEKLKGVFPSSYVLDLFEYQLDGKIHIDVMEFNPIHASGIYLYNSCMNKSDDILHTNLRKISYEFIDKIEECTTEGKEFNDRSILYDVPNSFSNDLRSICLTGKIGTKIVYDLNLSEEDFARHNPIQDFSSAVLLSDDFFSDNQELCLPNDLSDEMIEKIKKIIERK